MIKCALSFNFYPFFVDEIQSLGFMFLPNLLQPRRTKKPKRDIISAPLAQRHMVQFAKRVRHRHDKCMASCRVLSPADFAEYISV